MSYFRSGDPLDDFDRYDMEIERRLARRPVCSHCGHRIQDEQLWDINGELYCPKCAEQEFCKWTEDYEE